MSEFNPTALHGITTTSEAKHAGDRRFGQIVVQRVGSIRLSAIEDGMPCAFSIWPRHVATEQGVCASLRSSY